MNNSRFPWWLAPLLLSLAGCAPTARQPADNPLLDWGRNVVLADRSTELQFRPSIGRVMHLSRTGEPNILWHDVNPTRDTPGHWVNYGGDKLWPWPQKGAWNWPPSQAIDVGPYRIVRQDPLAFRAESPIDAASGLMASRETTLRDGVVLNTYTLTRGQRPATGAASPTVAAWSVTQVSLGRFFAHLRPAGSDAPITPMSETMPAARPVGGGWVEIVVAPGSRKVGLAADILAAHMGDQVLLIKRVAGNDDGALPRGVAAQLFTCDESWGRYAELEFLGPERALRVGEQTTLQTQWSILAAIDFEGMLKPYPFADINQAFHDLKARKVGLYKANLTF